MIRFIFGLVLCAVLCQSAVAGGRGGHSVAFDPNSYGGGWTCFRTLASGTCGGATTQYFNAACDGSTNDGPAVAAWLTYGVSQGTAAAKLYIPPGSNCSTSDGTTQITTGVQNATIWGYGASFKVTGVSSNVWIGGSGFTEDNSHSALIQTASAGASSVTLVTAADSSIFSVGSWICVDALAIQQAGQPPNFQAFEYKLITAITGTTTKVITLDSPLANTYLSTLPAPNDAEHGGPATIHLMNPTWNTNVKILGLAIKRNSIFGGNVIGRTILLQDMVFEGQGPNYTATQNAFGFGLNVADPMEVDKNIERLTFYNVVAPQMAVQSASLGILNLINVRLTYVPNSLSGTGRDTTVINSIIPLFRVGPTCCGKGQSITVDQTTITSATQSFNAMFISDFTFSGGVLSIPIASGAFAGAVQWGVPGAVYYFNYNGAPSLRNSDGTGAPVKFTITGLTGDGTNFNYATDIAGAFPTPLFGGQAANRLVMSPSVTIKQLNSPAGSADITAFAGP